MCSRHLAVDDMDAQKIMKENNQPLVSILIPLYNQEKYFKTCIRSACRQTYSNLEIIVINDGSTDRSQEIADEWARKDNRIKVVHKKNEGALKARFDAYRLSNGDFIMNLDSDDYLPKNAIEILLTYMIEKEVDLVKGLMAQVIGIFKFKNNGKGGSFPFHQVVQQPELFDKYYLNFFGVPYFSIMTTGTLFRKSVIDKAMKNTHLCCHGIEFVGEDHYIFMKLFPYLNSMYRTDENVYFYRSGGLSTDRFSPTYPGLFVLSEERLKLLDYYKLSEGYLPLFEEYANTVFYHAKQLLLYKQADRDGVIEFLREELSTRNVVPRMKAFVSEQGTNNLRLQLIVNDDYVGIYENVRESITHIPLKQRIKKLILRFLS